VRGRSPGGIRLSFLLISLGCISYVTYVTGGFLVGAKAFASFPRTSTSTSTFPLGLLSQNLSMPKLTVPFVSSPLSLIPDWAGTDRVNILLLGVDQRDDERDIGLPTRSDVIMVASIDPVQKTAALVSFPRDLWVTIPGFGEERINAAFRTGELRKVEGGGPALAAQTIERNFGIRTPYYVLVDFNGFEQIVDTLGGVIIDVPRPLKDDEYPTADYGTERVFFLPGPQLMNGTNALRYARTRHSDSDFARMSRQQQTLRAMRDRALRLNLLPQLPTLADQGLKAIQTNLSPTELLSLAKLAGQMEPEAMASVVVEGNLVTSFSGIGGAALLLPNRPAITRAIQQALADPRVVTEAARVEISATPALQPTARQLVDRLSGYGIANARVVNVSGVDPDATLLITNGQKPKSTAAMLAALSLPQRVVNQAAQEGAVDIRLVLGRDFETLSQAGATAP
jgi:polyisoprenyl-teichoic acid--peptidoglycan teichoic acid transferase